MEKEKERDGNKCFAWYHRVSDTYEKGILWLQFHLNSSIGSIGASGARNPVAFIVVSLLLAGLAGAGWARFRIESAGDKLWVPQESKAKTDEDYIDKMYVPEGGSAQFVATVSPSFSGSSPYGNNVLQPAVFWSLFQLDALVRAINVSSGGRSLQWTDVCGQTYEGTCSYDTPTFLWGNDLATFSESIGGDPNNATSGDQLPIIGAVNQGAFPDGSSLSLLSVFAGLTVGTTETGIKYAAGATVVAMPYSLRDGLGGAADDWYNAFIDVMKAYSSPYINIAYIAENSVDDEITRSVSADLYLVVVSVAIFVLVAVAGMSRWHRVATRSGLALLGVVSAVMATGAGYGIAMVMGQPFTTLTQTLPFVLLGLSVDCMFLLTKGYDALVEHDTSGSLESRFRALMATTGSNVVITLLASAVAFALGAFTELPSVAWFSVYATLGVTCIIVATLTFFVGVHVLTERRISSNRLDCCCCAVSGAAPVASAARVYTDAGATTGMCCGRAASSPAVAGKAKSSSKEDIPTAVILPPTGPGGEEAAGVKPDHHSVTVPATLPPTLSVTKRTSSSFTHRGVVVDPTIPVAGKQEPNFVKMLFSRYYAPFLTKWYTKLIVVAVFAGYFIMTGIGIPRLQEGQPLSELAPDDSYLQDYNTIMTNTFQQQTGNPTNCYFRYIDQSDPAEQAKMLQALGTALGSTYINATVSAYQSHWLLSFINYMQVNASSVKLDSSYSACTVNPFTGRLTGDLAQSAPLINITGCVPKDVFYVFLPQFLTAHASFRDDIVLSNGTIVTSAMPLVHTAQGNEGAYGRLLINNVRSVEDWVNSNIFGAENAASPSYVFFMYNDDYIYDEGDAILGGMTMEYVLLAVAGVGFVLLFTLPSPRAVLLMMLAVGLVDYCLFGEMFMINIRFNQVSVINMIMATGLAVDYSVYFAQSFVQSHADGTKDGRMVHALSETGSAVFVGGMTALSGTIPLAFAGSAILRTFFALIFGTIAYALLIGLMLMPVLFSLIGPPPLKFTGTPADGTAVVEKAHSVVSAVREGSRRLPSSLGAPSPRLVSGTTQMATWQNGGTGEVAAVVTGGVTPGTLMARSATLPHGAHEDKV